MSTITVVFISPVKLYFKNFFVFFSDCFQNAHLTAEMEEDVKRKTMCTNVSAQTATMESSVRIKTSAIPCLVSMETALLASTATLVNVTMAMLEQTAKMK